MSQAMMFAFAGLGCSVFLLVQLPARLWPAVATVAAGLELLKGLGLLHLSVSGLSLSLVLGAALAVAGALCWAKLSGKLHVTAATVIMLVGVSQVLTGALPR